MLALGGLDEISGTYTRKLDQVLPLIFKKCFTTGFIFGLSNMLMFITFGLTFFLSVVFVTNYNINSKDSLSAIFLIFFACFSAGNKVNVLKDLINLNEAVRWIFTRMDLEDEC